MNSMNVCLSTNDTNDTSPRFLQHSLDRTNRLSKAVAVMCNVIRCFQKWKNRIKDIKQRQSAYTEVETSRLAHLALIRTAQGESFGYIINHMQENATFEDALEIARKKHQVSQQQHSTKKLVPFLDQEGILRVGGRLDYATNLTEEAKHPALLPPDYKITTLFILDCHGRLAHQSTEWTIASLSSDIGVRPIGGVRAVRSLPKDCFICILLRKDRAEQLMAPLPDYRIKPREAVFNSVAIDYAGSYEVKRGRSGWHVYLFAMSQQP